MLMPSFVEPRGSTRVSLHRSVIRREELSRRIPAAIGSNIAAAPAAGTAHFIGDCPLDRAIIRTLPSRKDLQERPYQPCRKNRDGHLTREGEEEARDASRTPGT